MSLPKPFSISPLASRSGRFLPSQSSSWLPIGCLSLCILLPFASQLSVQSSFVFSKSFFNSILEMIIPMTFHCCCFNILEYAVGCLVGAFFFFKVLITKYSDPVSCISPLTKTSKYRSPSLDSRDRNGWSIRISPPSPALSMAPEVILGPLGLWTIVWKS